MKKSTLKNKFSSKRLKIEQNTSNIKADFEIYSTRKFDFRLRWTFFKVRKLVPRSTRSQSWLCPFKENGNCAKAIAKFGKISTYVTTSRLNKCTKQRFIWIFQRSRTFNGIKASNYAVIISSQWELSHTTIMKRDMKQGFFFLTRYWTRTVNSQLSQSLGVPVTLNKP